MKRRLSLFLAAVVLALTLAGLAIVAAAGLYALSASNSPDPRAEYYRAMYDVCVAQMGDRELCRRSVAGYVEKGWYEAPSEGWDWPLDTARDAPLPTPTPRPERNPANQRLQQG